MKIRWWFVRKWSSALGLAAYLLLAVHQWYNATHPLHHILCWNCQ